MRKFAFVFLPMLSLLFFLSSTGMINNSRAASFYFCGPSGSGDGSPFSDGRAEGVRVAEIRVHDGALIDSIQIVYAGEIYEDKSFESAIHGGEGGGLSVFELEPDEYITEVAGKYDQYVNSFFIKTNKGRKKIWGGEDGKTEFVYEAPPGTRINGFFGRAGDYLNAIGVIIQTIE